MDLMPPGPTRVQLLPDPILSVSAATFAPPLLRARSFNIPQLQTYRHAVLPLVQVSAPLRLTLPAFVP
jgi:hypothetical protein